MMTPSNDTIKQPKSIAIVTGASSGLGQEYVKYLCEKFPLDEIWLAARRKDRLYALADTLSVPSKVFPLDLADEKAIEVLSLALEKEQPFIQFLINAAGFGKMGSYKDIPLKELDHMVLVNCKAMMDITQICIPYTKKGSRILEISSVASFQPLPGFNVYAASKAFVTSYSRALHWELFLKGIKVTGVCPYWIRDTEFIETTKSGTARPDAIRHFMLGTTAKKVVRNSMFQNKIGLGIATPGIISTLYRLGAKFVPHEIAIAAWEGLRRL
ncbi:SDR family NAD(P)-dependent oxidoreductase [Brotonthovivens ammoniilytica]|uniref:SDR family NAD(P)-dependent oxidoreductase n=1 Tax=Brotonthovivens ammoniilytica TaxID=2981725 RepID=A0ABT2TNM8_9FIRM|nr:SDR family NAD(P)-dependent oxidoreductase [Brotonthovivens ammoniilytica]MCU6763692.1 SDR family NAD(P)-dependent oxidoreductase [Brotonthovivens ammoniilytica]